MKSSHTACDTQLESKDENETQTRKMMMIFHHVRTRSFFFSAIKRSILWYLVAFCRSLFAHRSVVRYTRFWNIGNLNFQSRIDYEFTVSANVVSFQFNSIEFNSIQFTCSASLHLSHYFSSSSSYSNSLSLFFARSFLISNENHIGFNEFICIFWSIYIYIKFIFFLVRAERYWLFSHFSSIVVKYSTMRKKCIELYSSNGNGKWNKRHHFK